MRLSILLRYSITVALLTLVWRDIWWATPLVLTLITIQSELAGIIATRTSDDLSELGETTDTLVAALEDITEALEGALRETGTGTSDGVPGVFQQTHRP